MFDARTFVRLAVCFVRSGAVGGEGGGGASPVLGGERRHGRDQGWVKDRCGGEHVQTLRLRGTYIHPVVFQVANLFSLFVSLSFITHFFFFAAAAAAAAAEEEEEEEN